MTLARNIYNVDGKMLLAVGTVLDQQYIMKLKNLSIPGVYVHLGDQDFDVELPEEVLSEETKILATKNLFRTFQKCQLTNNLDVKKVQKTTQTIIENLLQNKNNVHQLTDVRRYDNYTFYHSISVCALATMLGILRGYSPKRLSEVSIGALLHDVGKVKISPNILNKPEKLTDEEMQVMKTHSEEGFKTLRKNRELSVVPMHVAYQHHEKFDGTGYPRGLKGDSIHEYARIVAIADVYDALTSDRAYKKACHPYEAYKIMIEMVNSHFDPELFELFFNHVAVFPVGTTVMLNDGGYAIVIEIKNGETFTPKVKFLADSNYNKVSGEVCVDLAKQNRFFITDVLNDVEVFDLLDRTQHVRFA